jgi:tetraacyldisaccharide 4'-kinase
VPPEDLLSVALWPVAAVYGGVVRLRAALYRHGVLPRRRLGGVVISVGNLTVGGTGKTPMVLWLAERLAAEGQRPAILTRGYQGEGERDEKGEPWSDEVALLRQRLEGRALFGVGKDRYASGRALEREGTRWFILDDGFQHLALERDADIVLLDASSPFGGGRILPAGRLREPRTALARADIVVITRSGHAPALETMVRWFTRAPIFYASTELEAVLRAPALEAVLPDGERARMKFFAFCAIGNPAAFFDDLGKWEFTVAGERRFRDHHRYSPAEMDELEHAAAAAGADAMICTEKDVFNLRAAPATEMPIYACRIRMAVSDAEGFWRAILEATERRAGSRA